MEEFEEFMAEMLEEYNYDKDAVMVTTAFAQALANEWGKQLLIQRVVKSFCDCGGYASNKTESNRGECDNCKKEKV